MSLEGKSYNERLFTSGIRAKLHLARYEWLSKKLNTSKFDYDSILELGCYDGKVIDYLPKKPMSYLGLDAGWEGGLDIARRKYDGYEFKKCTTPTEMEFITNGVLYDISICMETLEHLPPHMMDEYLSELKRVTRRFIFITIPNEIGIIFLTKMIVKKIIFLDSISDYSTKEIVYQTIGLTRRVSRNQHKGFNYHECISSISKHFNIIDISGIPMPYIPLLLNFNIGIIGEKI